MKNQGWQYTSSINGMYNPHGGAKTRVISRGKPQKDAEHEKKGQFIILILEALCLFIFLGDNYQENHPTSK